MLTLVAFSAGTVGFVRVREGQPVHQGDVLVEISGELDSASLGSTYASVSTLLEEQRTRVQSDLAKTEISAQKQSEAFQDRIGLLQARLTQIDGQMALQEQQASASQKMLGKIEPLASKGYVSVYQVEQEKSSLLALQSQYKALAGQRLSIQQELSEAKQQLEEVPRDFAVKRSDIQSKLTGLAESLTQNEAKRVYILRAPSNGVVSTILFKEGQVVGAGEPVIALLPKGAVLQAQLLVPSRAIGFVEPGSRVMVRYQAFPYQKFGQQVGRVIDISRNALNPSEVERLTGKRTQEPQYRVMVELERQDISAYGKIESLMPGMMLDADILMDRRRLIGWIFEPLQGLRQRLSGGEL